MRDEFMESADSHLPHIFLGNMDGCQSRLDIRADGHIVEANNGNILGDPITGFPECSERSHGDQIVVGEIAIRQRFPPGKKLLHIRIGPLHGRRQPVNDRTGGGHAVSTDRLIKPVCPFFKVVDGV